jgi:hypothetical protein
MVKGLPRHSPLALDLYNGSLAAPAIGTVQRDQDVGAVTGVEELQATVIDQQALDDGLVAAF